MGVAALMSVTQVFSHWGASPLLSPRTAFPHCVPSLLSLMSATQIFRGFPRSDAALAAADVAALVATPSFAPWLEGVPVDIPSLLWTPEGKPRAAGAVLAVLAFGRRGGVVGWAAAGVI